jgi:hypothetical protein
MKQVSKIEQKKKEFFLFKIIFFTLTPIKFSRPSTTPHGENPIQTMSDLALGDLEKSASPTCLTTPRNLIPKNQIRIFEISFFYLVDIHLL